MKPDVTSTYALFLYVGWDESSPTSGPHGTPRSKDVDDGATVGTGASLQSDSVRVFAPGSSIIVTGFLVAAEGVANRIYTSAPEPGAREIFNGIKIWRRPHRSKK